jgi:2-oxoisovalerate dehydrogenase E1 component alpha subunit
MMLKKAFRPLSRGKSFLLKHCNRLYTNEATFPGAPTAEYTNSLHFLRGNEKPFPIFRIMDSQGNVVNKEKMEIVKKSLTNEKLVHMYKTIVLLNVMDDILYNAQRQGRVSFYMTNYGEECIQIGSTEGIESKSH